MRKKREDEKKLGSYNKYLPTLSPTRLITNIFGPVYHSGKIPNWGGLLVVVLSGGGDYPSELTFSGLKA